MAFEQTLAEYQAFPQQFRSLMLSTVSADGSPHASYAPFVVDAERNFYIYVSGLSAHTANLKRSQQVSVLLIEDEAQTQQVFARRRLNYLCAATVLAREGTAWGAIADRFEARFGEIIAMLKTLADFEIFQLQPRSGRFIVGFGAAYRVDPQDLSRLLPIKKG
ncbi:MAG: HugZ family protein [Leptolyngbya sp. SIO4C1]|nr:HugZ family protein [Leptolyngbya sp. SIO4C1]